MWSSRCLCLFIVCAAAYICFFLFYLYGDHRDLHSFPTRRSSDLEIGVDEHAVNLVRLGCTPLCAFATYARSQSGRAGARPTRACAFARAGDSPLSTGAAELLEREGLELSIPPLTSALAARNDSQVLRAASACCEA